jgi:hypothetical protein
MLVFQSKAQIDAAYGTKADVVVANAVTKVFFAGLSDRSTLDYAASLLGHEHATQHSTSHDLGGLLGAAGAGPGGRHTLSHAPTRVELLPAPLLRQVAPGQALLVHNTLPPAHLHGRYWYRTPELYELATGQPLGGQQPTRRAARRRTRRRTQPAGHPTANPQEATAYATGDAAAGAPDGGIDATPNDAESTGDGRQATPDATPHGTPGATADGTASCDATPDDTRDATWDDTGAGRRSGSRHDQDRDRDQDQDQDHGHGHGRTAGPGGRDGLPW